MAASFAAALLSLAGCEREQQVGGGQPGAPADRSVAETMRQEGRELGQESRELASEARTAAMGAAAEGEEAASRAGAMADDAQITTLVNAGLAADKDLSALKINVDTKEGVVTLRGTAPSATAKARASEIARNVKDVRSVNNELEVRAG